MELGDIVDWVEKDSGEKTSGEIIYIKDEITTVRWTNGRTMSYKKPLLSEYFFGYIILNKKHQREKKLNELLNKT